MSNMTKKSNGSNGTATLEVLKNAGNGSVVAIEEVTAELEVEEAPAEVVAEKVIETPKPAPKPEPVISVERRIEKVEELKITIAKYQQLQDARKGLTSFRLGSDGMTASLTLKDADGKPYSISNPVVVDATLNHIRQVLNEKIHETEQEINFSV